MNLLVNWTSCCHFNSEKQQIRRQFTCTAMPRVFVEIAWEEINKWISNHFANQCLSGGKLWTVAKKLDEIIILRFEFNVKLVHVAVERGNLPECRCYIIRVWLGRSPHESSTQVFPARRNCSTMKKHLRSASTTWPDFLHVLSTLG